VCAGAEGPLEHDHFFTEAGAFGSHDENGEQVDEGDFTIVDDDTVGFPSHASEFGYDGDLVVGYAFSSKLSCLTSSCPTRASTRALTRMPGLCPRSRPARGIEGKSRRK
jgi:hypothetical protein